MQLYDIPEYSLNELYDYYNRTIDLAASYDWAVHPRTQFHVQSALRDYRKFSDGELDIDLGTKRWFRVMSHLVEEVGDLDDNQTALVLALAEIGHAAAHLGPLNTALSRGGRTEADVKYEELNRAYVKHAADYETVRRECEKQLPGVPVVYTVGDVCRDDLLVELEAVAHIRRQ